MAMSEWDNWIRQNASLFDQRSNFELEFVNIVLRKIRGINPMMVTAQLPIKTQDGPEYRVDFAVQIPECLKLAIEVDGWDKTGQGIGETREQHAARSLRDAQLVKLGWTIHHYANGQFTRNPGIVAAAISTVVDNAIEATLQRKLLQRQVVRGRVLIVTSILSVFVIIMFVIWSLLGFSIERRPSSLLSILQEVSPQSVNGRAAPNGLNCPDTHLIKGNRGSRSTAGWIYHLPGSSLYASTVPEDCFTTVDAATTAGYRAPRNLK